MGGAFLDPMLDSIERLVAERDPLLVAEAGHPRQRSFRYASHPGCSVTVGVARHRRSPSAKPPKLWYAQLLGPSALIALDGRSDIPRASSLEASNTGRNAVVRLWSSLQAIDADRAPAGLRHWVIDSISWLVELLVKPTDARAEIATVADFASGGTLLWCEPGRHAWSRPPWRGRPPRSCPEHDAPDTTAHPAHSSDCFQLDDGWGLRLVITGSLRCAKVLDIPEGLAPQLDLRRDDVLALKPGLGDGPMLTVRRGRHRMRCFGEIGALVPTGAENGDLLFITLRRAGYGMLHVPAPVTDDPVTTVARLVGLTSGEDRTDLFWHRVARRLGHASAEPSVLAGAARARGDSELGAAIDAASRAARGSGGWVPAWDITARLHPDHRYMAVAGAEGRCRVAVGVADPRDRLSSEFIVTEGGLVWVEVGEPEEAKRVRVLLSPDVAAPPQSERWVRLMRLEQQARRASLAGTSWRLEPHGNEGWRVSGGDGSVDLTSALAEVGSVDSFEVNAGIHLRHVIPRSAIALDRAIRSARSRALVAVESDHETGFAAVWKTGRQRASSLLGTLLTDGIAVEDRPARAH